MKVFCFLPLVRTNTVALRKTSTTAAQVQLVISSVWMGEKWWLHEAKGGREARSVIFHFVHKNASHDLYVNIKALEMQRKKSGARKSLVST